MPCANFPCFSRLFQACNFYFAKNKHRILLLLSFSLNLFKAYGFAFCSNLEFCLFLGDFPCIYVFILCEETSSFDCFWDIFPAFVFVFCLNKPHPFLGSAALKTPLRQDSRRDRGDIEQICIPENERIYIFEKWADLYSGKLTDFTFLGWKAFVKRTYFKITFS